MPAKRQKSKKPENLNQQIVKRLVKVSPSEDYVVKMLKNRFLSLAKEERVPFTPEITDQLDNLLLIIRDLERENAENLDQDFN